MRRFLYRHRKRPTDFSRSVEHKEKQALLELVKQYFDRSQWKLQLLRDMFGAQGLTIVTRELSDREVPHPMMLRRHESKSFRGTLPCMFQVCVKYVSRHL